MPDTTLLDQPPRIAPELMELVYDELRAIARRSLRGEHDENSLGATGLVHEAVARLLDSEGFAPGASPSAVLAMAVQAMGRVLIDRARGRRALKRGGRWRRLSLDDVLDAMAPPGVEFGDLYEALDRLGERHERLRRMVVLRYLVGMSNAEIAEVEGVGIRAVEANLHAARALLRAALGGGV
jgi:RNA polymerase sigma factor (TIGR02999 family)